jgi:hypothetical protein
MEDIMKDIIKTTMKSGGTKFDITIRFNGVLDGDVQDKAMEWIKWRIANTVRNASDADKDKWAKNGIDLHFTEVGKKIKSVDETVEGMSDAQALEALELLKKRLNK